MEVWKPYEGVYEVSSEGRVRADGERIVGQWMSQAGYMLVRLSSPRRVGRVHRMVAQAFIPNPNDKPFVNHIDNDTTNNTPGNLEWCTQAENLTHARKQDRLYRHPKGVRPPSALLTDEQVRAARAAYGPHTSLARLAAQFGISKRAMGRLIARETYDDVQ